MLVIVNVALDSQWYVTDPETRHIPTAELLSKVGGFCAFTRHILDDL